MTVANRKILIIGPSWVGDMVLAHSLFQLLKQQRPNTQIDVAAPAWTLPLLERMPEITEKIALNFKHGQLALLERIRFGNSLKSKGYTQAILLVNSFKSAILPFAAGIPIRTGYLGEMRYGLVNDVRALDKNKLPRTVDRFNALSVSAGSALPNEIANPKLHANTQDAKLALTRLGLPLPSSKVLGLCPGAEYGEAKRWPAAYYAEVALSALDKGWQVWLFGSDKDSSVTKQINQICHEKCIDFGGKTNLSVAIDLMTLCDTVISNDSGLMHVAAALDKKVIAIYGSSDPHHTPPMHPDAVIEYLGLSCSPCFKRECPLTHVEAHLACLKNILPSNIIKQINAHV
ncbi:MAG: lipopolysaccharide heptosyltransferase II [Methylophilaceae bacterium]|nr:lipopolysaccharide heptosyltransferase II [Methylophilaceae bacterium]